MQDRVRAPSRLRHRGGYHRSVGRNPEHREHDRDDDDLEHAYEPLVERLRNLTWPEVPEELRERCWREFQKMMEGRGRRRGEEAASDDG